MSSKLGFVGQLAVLLVLLCAAQARAEQAQMLRQEQLRAEPYADARTLAEIGKDARVEVLGKQGGWTLIGTGGRQGWVRSLSLRGASPATVQVSQGSVLALESGRSGHGDLIATTGIRGISRPASPQIHALIMTIGAYREGIPQLTGVKYDAETARQIARRMGVQEGNMRILRDDELTLEGMGSAFDQLENQVQQDDQVFIYYSGHGGRQLVKEENREDRCAESLISVDGYGFVDNELEARLKRLSAKAQKLIVLLDACHSGGATTRALVANAPSAEFTPKYWQGKGGMDACAKPVNVVTRGILAGTRSVGSGANNYTYIAAARDNEISLDQPGKGGVASQAWLECMSGAAQDLDGSGGLSAEEIRACAQEKIDRKLSGAVGVLPHHVSITGNSRTVLGFAADASAAISLPPPTAVMAAPVPAAPAPAAPAQVAPTTVVSAPTVSTTIPPASAALPVPAAAPLSPAPTAAASTAAPAAPMPAAEPPPAPPAKPNPVATLEDIFGNRDDRRLVEMKTARQKLKIDQDKLEFTLTSSHEGHVYLLMVGTDGTTFDLLFPNQLDRNNLIQAGETLKLPRPSWELAVQGPPGKDTLLAIVTESPRDFSRLGMQPAGPFSVIDAQAVPTGSRDIQLVTGSSSNAGAGECLMQKTRNLAVQKRCSNAYGAALLIIEEAR